ncbi:MAG: metallopeptidase family protein [Planctomycetes bacterium]|nr:metallopeptidase family protein [Planctomycetota bacterium]
MSPRQRERFDRLLERVIDALPDQLRRLLDEAPVIVEDRPDPALLRDLGMDADDDDLCGLHSGAPITQRSHSDVPDMPETIHLFRQGIIEEAGGWGGPDAEKSIESEIRVTLLHEVGHHFGLEEDDLEELGYD